MFGQQMAAHSKVRKGTDMRVCDSTTNTLIESTLATSSIYTGEKEDNKIKE